MLLFTGFIVVITLLDIIVYYLRLRQEGEEEDYGERKYSSSLLSDQQCHSSLFLPDHQCRRFSLAEIKSATQDFDEALVIGKGGFGKVYIGIIENVASTVAIKRLDFGSNQGAPEFWTEIEMLSKFRHSHLVSLIGYCNDHLEMIIVYEYMPNGTLEDNLHKIRRSNRDGSSPLSWVQRLKICIGAAHGLDYLHTGTGTLHRVIHRDVKTSNILLDENMEAKISDFGLCKIGPTNQLCTHVSTNVKGTFGYLDPEYFLTRRLTRKSDVYAFGVVLLEVLCGRPAVDIRLYEEQWSLAEWAKHCIKGGKIDLLVDPSLRGSILYDCLDVFSHIADRCLENCSKRRPTMTEVVSKLELALELQERANSRGAEAENISTGGASDNQDSMNSYTEKDMSNPCPGMDSFAEQEVVDAHNIGHSHGQINGVLHLGGTSRVQSHERPAKKMTFVKKVCLFFSPKDHSVSAADDIFKERGVLDGLESLPFDFGIIRIATDNFADANMLGQGGFGPVYKGRLQNGQEIAVKMLARYSRQGGVEFRNEVMIMGKLRHKNLVRLLGFSVKGVKKLLIYEFVPNGSLDHFLFDPLMRPHLDWDRRYKIIGGVGRGLLYLHEDSSIQIIHRDIKPSNILIDAEFNAKISDLGLASPQNQRESECNTDLIAGTPRYMAPEYLRDGHFSVKSDVFSFGILVLEIISGKKMNSFEVDEGAVDLLSYAWRHWREGTPLELVDLTLRVGPSVGVEVVRCIQIGLLCVQESTVDRPTTGSVVLMLSSLSPNLPEPSEPAYLVRGNDNQTRSPSTAYSSGTYSITDLYPR